MATNTELCIIGEEKSKTDLKLLMEAEKIFGSVFFVPISGIRIGLTEKFSITYRTTDILKFKVIFPRIPKAFFTYAYQLLSLFPDDTFMPIRPISFLLANERFFLLTVLRKRGIDTLNIRLANTKEAAARVIENNRFPFVIRVPEKKSGIVVKNKMEAKSIIDTLAGLKQPILIEDAIEDLLSVYVAEPEVIASVKKKTKEKDIVLAAGEFKKCKIDQNVRNLALNAAKAVEAKVVRVDISLNKKPKIVNILLNPDLITPSKITGKNLPREVIKSIHSNYKLHLERPMIVKFFEEAKSVVKDVLKTKQLL